MKYLITLTLLFTAFFTISAQQVTTLATITPNFGDGMIVTPQGDLLVSGGWNKDNILKITPEGVVSDHVTGLPGPVGMGFDSEGNLYVTNYSGNNMSKITPEGVVSEFASDLDGPAGLFVSDQDEIFVTLYGASFSGNGNTVLKFDVEGNVLNYAVGSGIHDAIGVVMDENRDMYVTNYGGGNVYKVDAQQNISNLGTVTGAQINQIVYTNGYVYVPSPNLRKIYRVNTANGDVEHFAGTGGDTTTDGALLDAQFHFPNSCAISETGDTLYILDGKVGKIRVIDLSETTGFNEVELSNGFNLEQNFPNPFSAATEIKFTLPTSENVSLEVYDTQGRLVEKLLDQKMNTGNHTVSLNLTNASNGFYYYKLVSGKFVAIKSMINQ